jgi:hypothetical protein
MTSRTKPNPAPRNEAAAETEKVTPPPSMALEAKIVNAVAAIIADIPASGERQAVVDTACAVLRTVANDNEHTWLHDTDLLVIAERVSMMDDAA